MNRQEFVFTLYNNGNGLTLDQIQKLDESMIDYVPDGMIEDLIENNELTKNSAIEVAVDFSRDVFVDNIGSTPDMLSLRDLFFESYKITLNDNQVYNMWLLFHKAS